MALDKELIDYKKLFFEVTMLLAGAFAVFIISLSPSIERHKKSKSKYENYYQKIDYVDSFDYSAGRNNKLEKSLDNAFLNSQTDESKFFNGIARASYYCNLGFMKTAKDTFDKIFDLAPNEEELHELNVRMVMCERKNANA